MPETHGGATGMLLIGDPHLEGRSPGFRSDNYPRAILDKLAWCLEYARVNRLLPVILGDLFDKPRDNPTWMLGTLLDLLGGTECVAIYGNHDCADPELSDHDSLSLLVKAGRVRLLDDHPWRGRMNGREVIVGGSSYRRPIPREAPCLDPGGTAHPAPLVLWVTHHDLIVPGYEEQGKVKPREIRGVQLVVNGHIHRRLEDVQTGSTLWMTPGNISRRSRGDATREHVPSVLRIDVDESGFTRQFVEVPHAAFDDVFHPAVVEAAIDGSASAFVAGLAELQARRTESGAGLMAFLTKNIERFDRPVADQIMSLAQEVADHGQDSN